MQIAESWFVFPNLRVSGVRGRRHFCFEPRSYCGRDELPPESWQITCERWDVKPPMTVLQMCWRGGEWELALKHQLCDAKRASV